MLESNIELIRQNQKLCDLILQISVEISALIAELFRLVYNFLLNRYKLYLYDISLYTTKYVSELDKVPKKIKIT